MMTQDLFPRRASGVLLHPTSLPSRYGIGDLGEQAHRFVDILAGAAQTYWQMLPITPPGHGGSPYSSESAFAGNPALIDLDALAERGWLARAQLDALAHEFARVNPARAQLHHATQRKLKLLGDAWEVCQDDDEVKQALTAFVSAQSDWLEDYVLFAALKLAHPSKSWRDWPRELVVRNPLAMERARQEHAGEVARQTFYQWVFFEQWQRLRAHALERGVALIGDIPIFVAMDSADVWANRHLFKLDASAQAEVVAGVPPDYFSATGQKWGNPVYDWEACKKHGYSWWIRRVQKAMETMDLVRIDHFRGFQDYWETPSHEPTAMNGRWVKGPRDDFFEAIEQALGKVPFIAEDLGLVDDAVYSLRDRAGLPGMKVMHFAFGGEPEHPFLPHTYPVYCVGYLGTHDNNTTRGWYAKLDDQEKHRVRVYLSSSDRDITEKMSEELYHSMAALVILQAQDLWDLDASHRMNTPSTVEENWSWRMTREQLLDRDAWSWLEDLTELTDRAPEEP